MGTGTRIYLSEIEQNRSENECRIREIVRKMEVETEFERFEYFAIFFLINRT